MKKLKRCPRCEAVGRKPNEGLHMYKGINGIVSLLCDECNEEVKEEENFLYEIKEYKEPS